MLGATLAMLVVCNDSNVVVVVRVILNFPEHSTSTVEELTYIYTAFWLTQTRS